MRLVAPSMLSADFLSLAKDIAFVNDNADIFHLDVMDGTFVPNLSYGFPVIDAIAKNAHRPMDVHLMIVHPEKYVDRFAKSGAAMISFHLEAARQASEDPAELLKHIRSLGVKAGLAINPDVPVEDLYPYLKDADFVLMMSVFAGFGGQKFIEETYARLKTLKAEIDRQGVDCMIEVDGGISPDNADKVSDAGANILVAGSSIFKAQDPAEAARIIKGIR